MSTPIAAAAAETPSTAETKRNVAVLVFAHAVLGLAACDEHHRRGARRRGARRRPVARHAADLDRRRRLAASRRPAMSLFMGRYGRRAGLLGRRAAGAVGGCACARGRCSSAASSCFCGVRAARNLPGGAGLLSVRGGRHGAGSLQAESDLVGARGRAIERAARSRDRARDIGSVPRRAVRRRVPRGHRAERRRRRRARVS